MVEEAQGKPNGGNFNNNKGGNFNNNNKGGNFNKGGRPSDGNADIQTPTLFIGGLSYNSTSDSISEYFAQVGEVVRARVVTDRETGNVNFSLFSPVDSVMLSSMTSILPKRPIRVLTMVCLTADKSDLTVPVKDPLDKTEDKEDLAASVKEVTVVSVKVDLEVTEVPPETLATQLSILVWTTRTLRRVPLVHSKAKRSLYELLLAYFLCLL